MLIAVAGCSGDPCVGTLATICGDVEGTQPLQLDGPIDTDNDPRCVVITQPQVSGELIPVKRPELCVLTGTTIDVVGTIHAYGTRALVLVAADVLTISGTLDVSSRTGNMQLGAGADASTSSGLFFPSGAQQELTYVRGGSTGACPSTYEAAHSGGAVYAIAATQIRVVGSIFASAGAPRRSSSADGKGGCGGASGGLVALEAPHIDVDGIIAANGSGGAVGHLVEGNVSPGPQTSAENGTTTEFTTPARGGTLSGGSGGNGGAVDIPPTGGTAGDGIGPGGGGGSVGVFWVHGDLTGSQFSPAPTVQ
jgi:hypothetical protein